MDEVRLVGMVQRRVRGFLRQNALHRRECRESFGCGRSLSHFGIRRFEPEILPAGQIVRTAFLAQLHRVGRVIPTVKPIGERELKVLRVKGRDHRFLLHLQQDHLQQRSNRHVVP